MKHSYALSSKESEDYFRRLRWPLRIGLLSAFIVPLVILSLYFYFQFNVTLQKSGKLHLTNLAESQRNTIDLFLQERVINIFNLFHAGDFSLSHSKEDMESNLNRLRETSEAFVDVGFLGQEGIQSGYAGPYHYLQGRDYSREEWFNVLLERDRDYYISDIYLGFRGKPHFTIAVKQRVNERLYIMRATLDPDKFFMFLRTLGDGRGGDSALVNKEGKYQLVNPDKGELLGTCDFTPSTPAGSGADEMRTSQGSTLVAYAWLNLVPWILVVQQPLEIAYEEMYRAQWVLFSSIGVLVLLIVGAVWMTTGRLLRKAQAVQEARAELQSQLIHATKLASVGELAAGVAHEINNPLAIISAETGVIRDMLDPQFELDSSPDKITEELGYIDEAVFRAKVITKKLLDFARRNEPNLAPCNVNIILNEVVGGLKEQEFKVSNIELIREFDAQIPDALIDPDQIRQVFLNIINNAGDAISGGGTITLSTSCDGGFVRVAIADTGKGMTHDQIGKVFLPFYTTKEVGKGTGLGLSISFSIVEAMGGRIEIQSMPDKGSSFTVVLPVNQEEGPSNV
ncbi:MAG: ATP-binding protein [Planctomycetota bacterium]